ncbi:molybdopterin-dependent oxidoreductase [Bradyrhizobium sp. CCBAU 53338]|uniref:molybdopterin-dependent oxidoreductase n=1 Tax=Bradyrhizobium sp. CCBAU 53338 TaxID=1325111 RepID=UPI00188D702C|nr:molybdopterin-dependent oxidoreductase [Bradyrhizobium sp. CCBAU 53338]QOZ52551.1 molybdopterin oxidoreductase [Bradyrhizobium sp. CCBAU 53338]
MAFDIGLTACRKKEDQEVVLHLTHWGAFDAESDGKRLTNVRSWNEDPGENGLIANVASAQHHPARIAVPHVRAGWLEQGPGPTTKRGNDRFVAVSWEQALDLASAELRRVYRDFGADHVYGGSYGWASAGRFHHAQSQVHRFLNCLGGYVASVGNYSFGTAGVVLPHVLGSMYWELKSATAWSVIAMHTELFVAFGGLPAKNFAVSPGGISRHETEKWISSAKARGCRFISVGPVYDDPPSAGAEWIAARPGSDAAMMLALAHVLDTEQLADHRFLERYTVGFDRFAHYLHGMCDGVPKSPEWAESICEIPAERIRELAREMARSRTMIGVAWSLQRTQFGEQPVWLGVVLAAMLGQMGLPGGGVGHGYGSGAALGLPDLIASAPTFPQLRNLIDKYIPVSRIADMLLNPGSEYDYDGKRLQYPNIRLVYWAGGNPFHAHQDLGRLHDAFGRPDTVIVHDAFWTATARQADIVLPCTMTIERNDFGSGMGDPRLFPMPALTIPHGQAQDDYSIFARLAERLEVGSKFTEGRTAEDWLRSLYEEWRTTLAQDGHHVPSYEDFWVSRYIEIPVRQNDQVLLADFRTDPDANRLTTPSGRIEIFSERIDSFGYADCPGHPVWLEPEDWRANGRGKRFPLHLIANQPHDKLHSQLDVGEYSRSKKISGRAPLRINPDDAAARGLVEGQIVRVFNQVGACLAGLCISSNVRPGVVQLPTGAWYDPDPSDARFCWHGNPNVLTSDRGSSRLSQGCSGQHAMVEVEAYVGELKPPRVHYPPE